MPYYARFNENNIPQLLKDHEINVSNATRIFLSGIGLPKTGALLGLLHDLGKYHPDFQRYLKTQCGLAVPGDPEYSTAHRGTIPHAGAGARIFMNRTNVQPLLRDLIAMPVHNHHATPDNGIAPDGEPEFCNRLNAPYPHDLAELQAAFDPVIREKLEELLTTPDVNSELASWVSHLFKAANVRKIHEPNATVLFELGMLVRLLYSALIDADRLDAAGRTVSPPPDWQMLITRFENRIAQLVSDSPINQLRAQISQQCLTRAAYAQGVYRLPIPTGGGKTYSGMRFALHHAALHGCKRIFYIAPFTSILEQNADVIRTAFDDSEGKILLEHHSNLLPEKREDAFYRTISENWDAPVIFTTLVQFLEALFSGQSRSARRFHLFAESVILIDEVQSLPLHTTHLFNRAINFLASYCKTTVVLSSATQPRLDEVPESGGQLHLATPPDLIDDTKQLFDRLKRTRVTYLPDFPVDSLSETLAKIGEWAERWRSLLFITNSKAYARDLYKTVDHDRFDSLHLSTSMCPAHRRRVIAEIREKLNRPGKRPLLVFATSLIEAGVDVDFSCVVRSLAGLDSIAQAAGRCNRSGRMSPSLGEVFVIPNPRNYASPSSIEYGAQVARDTLELFAGKALADPVSPDFLNEYYRRFYGPEETRRLLRGPINNLNDTLLSLWSDNTRSYESYKLRNYNKPLLLRGAYRTAGENFNALDSFCENGIIVPWAEGEAAIAALEGCNDPVSFNRQLSRLQAYSVNVSDSTLRKLRDAKAVRVPANDLESGVLLLDSRFYDAATGLVLEAGKLATYTI